MLRLFKPMKQHAWRRLQRPCETDDIGKANVTFAPLNASHVGSVQFACCRKVFLG